MTGQAATGSGVDVPLAASQHLIWAGQQLQGDDPLYNMILAFRIHGAIDEAAFRAAFAALIAASDALRTVLAGTAAEPRQRVLSALDYELDVVDLSAAAAGEAALQAWLDAHRATHFDLAERHFESALLKLSPDEYVWYLNQHHVLTDATSVAILFEHMQGLYALALAGRLDEAESLPAYSDYVDYERAQCGKPAYERACAYWRERLAEPLVPSTFYGRQRGVRTGRTERVPMSLGAERSSRLRALAESTPFRAFTPDLAHFQIFATVTLAYLRRMTGNERLSLGTPTHNRASARFRRTAGLLIELFPLRVSAPADASFATLHREVASAGQELLVNALPGVSGAAQHNAYDVVLNFINATFGDFAGLPTDSEWIHSGYGDRNHLLRLQVQNFDRSDTFELAFDMNVEAFPEPVRPRVPAGWLRLCDAMLDDPGALIDEVDLIEPAERRVLLEGYREVRGVPRPEPTVVTAFEDAARRSPASPAVVENGVATSYRQLDERAGRMAHALGKHEVGPGTTVGLFMHRSVDAVAAMLAVLKRGAAYVPLDPAYPTSRLEFMLADAGARVVICDEDLASAAPRSAPVLTATEAARHAGAAFRSRARPEDLAYVIYTSGSTGRPKGVQIAHDSLSNYVAWAARRYTNDEPLAFPLFSSLAFDLTVTSIYVPLTTGGHIVVYRDGAATDGLLVRRIVEDDEVDVVKLTPAHLALLQGMDLAGSRISRFVLGGEDLKADLAGTISRRFGGSVRIFNEYGPTEGTVGCMTHEYDPERDTGTSVPIGRAIDGLDVYLLDARQRLVPPGVTGELYIGGTGVARGYLNRDELSAQRFVPDPFRPGGRLYASGDLATWDEHGRMVYLGRADQQVKVRGVRVEVGEVESVLQEHPAVEACFVAAGKRTSAAGSAAAATYCARCGLSSNHPDAKLDASGICLICRIYGEEEAQARAYFRDMPELERIAAEVRRSPGGPEACMMLLSGGKDSTYALCRLVDLGLRPLVFTLDNGFISEGAKANVRRVVEHLGLELVMASTEAMNEIFLDSLNRYSNVCNGCFKTIYTLSMKLAHERGIRHIFTGLSRGQVFETRVAGLFQQRVFDAELIDRTIIAARKAYHRMDDAVSRRLDVSLFQSDEIFEEIRFVDFYRYCDVTLDEILGYLSGQVPWIRPADTGRSTNCLINDAGIFVHKRERGFHNYALPYSWDVRLGHKERNAALAELDDAIDEDKVARILNEIGYAYDTPEGLQEHQALTAWYVASADATPEELRAWLTARLPGEFVPSHFVPLDALPLNTNGKVDREALPAPEAVRRELETEYVAPRNATEDRLASIWAAILGVDRVGMNDDFFELGGDSILNIQIVARAKKQGIAITPQQIFEHSTVGALAKVATRAQAVDAEQGPVFGPVRLTPVQARFLELAGERAGGCAQIVWLEIAGSLPAAVLEQALVRIHEHHDALRARFGHGESGWQQVFAPVGKGAGPRVEEIALDGPSEAALRDMEQRVAAASAAFDVGRGGLLHAFLFRSDATAPDVLVLVAHQLVVDGVSWWPLLEDLETLCLQRARGEPPALPEKTTSFRRWTESLAAYAGSPEAQAAAAHWLADRDVGFTLPGGPREAGGNLRGDARTVTVTLGAADTGRLLHDVPAAYAARVPELVFAAVVIALSEWSGQSALRIDVEGHGRESTAPEIELLRTVGWFTSVYPLVVRLGADRAPSAVLSAVKDRFHAVPNRGLDHGALRHMGPAGLRAELGRLPSAPVLFNYLGHWDQALSASSLFRFMRPLELGFDARVPREHELEINALVHRGRLQVDWTFGTRIHREADVATVAARALEALRTLIAYCIDSRDSGLAPADFPAAELNRDELESLLEEFGESES